MSKKLCITEHEKNLSCVYCPICGNLCSKSTLGCVDYKCSRCGNNFRSFVVKGVVMSVTVDAEESAYDSLQRAVSYIKQMLALAVA